ncbi:hypothetical protein EBT31_15865 [bacterium]|jgi:hypothetical protein|nr:hypothetical protein [bacterium]
MGKLKQNLVESLETLDAVDSPDVDEDTRQEYWARDNALTHALALHKINGGMKNVNQVLADAHVILNFLKGGKDE